MGVLGTASVLLGGGFWVSEGMRVNKAWDFRVGSK